jgi:hypothetical protein
MNPIAVHPAQSFGQLHTIVVSDITCGETQAVVVANLQRTKDFQADILREHAVRRSLSETRLIFAPETVLERQAFADAVLQSKHSQAEWSPVRRSKMRF